MNLPDDFTIEPGAHIGVSGSRHGPTPEALAALRFMIDQCSALGARFIHHGCCTGWDELSVPLAKKAGMVVIAHPPVTTIFLSCQAWKESDICLKQKPYEARDMDIAYESAVLLIGPRYPEDDPRSQRSGTWLTTRHARRYGCRVYSCDPEGNIADVTEARCQHQT